MNHDYTIGFKYRNKDYTAYVRTHSTAAFLFYRVTLNDKDLIGEFGPYINLVQDALTINVVKSMRVIPTELENTIIDELNRITR